MSLLSSVLLVYWGKKELLFMVKLKKIMSILFLISVVTANLTFAYGFKEMVVKLEVPAYTQTSDSRKTYTMSTTESQMMYSEMLAASGSNGMSVGDSWMAALKPEICDINTAKLLQKKYSEKEQKEVLQQLRSANAKKITLEEDIQSPELM